MNQDDILFYHIGLCVCALVATYIICVCLIVIQNFVEKHCNSFLSIFMDKIKNGSHAEKHVQSKDCLMCRDASRYSSFLVTPCNHEFHMKCLKKWLQKNSTCPVCQLKFSGNFCSKL